MSPSVMVWRGGGGLHNPALAEAGNSSATEDQGGGLSRKRKLESLATGCLSPRAPSSKGPTSRLPEAAPADVNARQIMGQRATRGKVRKSPRSWSTRVLLQHTKPQPAIAVIGGYFLPSCQSRPGTAARHLVRIWTLRAAVRRLRLQVRRRDSDQRDADDEFALASTFYVDSICIHMKARHPRSSREDTGSGSGAAHKLSHRSLAGPGCPHQRRKPRHSKHSTPFACLPFALSISRAARFTLGAPCLVSRLRRIVLLHICASPPKPSPSRLTNGVFTPFTQFRCIFWGPRTNHRSQIVPDQQVLTCTDLWTLGCTRPPLDPAIPGTSHYHCKTTFGSPGAPQPEQTLICDMGVDLTLVLRTCLVHHATPRHPHQTAPRSQQAKQRGMYKR